ncbi:TPA: TIGR00266 family protein [Vibrio vulnificus]|uniref:TIGR00266 family protein n=1 Tax=Vibrio vulnificus TaxID=672 RepID=A0A8H9K5V5_VIBVL|nr:TIGR00266 family protein [Vibrio vulnificus]HAS8538461.1 TIGR00266 family protein [Vibrio vulnificus]
MNKQSHEVDYIIEGESIQMVTVELDPMETVVAEAGMMNYFDEGIEFETRLGDGSPDSQSIAGRMASVVKRTFTGESIFMTHFTNKGEDKATVAFAAPYTGKIIPFDLSKFDGEIICQKSSFLCAAKGTEVSLHLNKKIGSGFFGGEGFIMQKLSGDGNAFIHAGGHIKEVKLDGTKKLNVDTGCVVAMTGGIEMDIKRAGGLKTMVFGGEGIFLTELSGTGTVWLQSLPFSRLADQIIAFAPSVGGEQKGEGSILGSILRAFTRD